jgi:hypothetical protein
MGRCTGCGRAGYGNGLCASCSSTWNRDMMDTAYSAGQTGQSLHMAIWSDGGCLGCTTARRRMFLFITAALAALAGVIGFIVVAVEGAIASKFFAYTIPFGISCFCIFGGAFFPDGIGGMYRNQGGYQQA